MTEELTNPQGLKGEDLLIACRLNPAKYRRVSAMPQGEATAAMMKILMGAYALKGQRPKSNETVPVLAAEILNEISGNEFGVASLSFEEIAWVVRQEAIYNEDFFISVASIYRALVKYAKGLGHDMQARADGLKRKIENPAVKAYLSALSVDIVDKFKLNK